MSLKNSITNFCATTRFNLQKHSPDILVAAGIVGGIAACVLACKATLKAEKILDEHQEMMEKVKKVKEESPHNDIYNDKDYKRDVACVYTKTIVKFGKLYWPAATLGVLSIGCVLKAHDILSERNLSLLAAYKCSEEAFKSYRARVAEKLGKNEEEKIRYNVHKTDISSVDNETGEVKTETFLDADPETYADDPSKILFDEFNPNWNKDADRNWVFLRGVQDWCNRKLISDGHLFLNDVRYELGLEAIPEGQLLGWILPKEGSRIVGDGDGYVDFGLFNNVNDNTVEGVTKRDFLFGVNPSVMIELNYDGVIWDKI